MPDLSLDKLFLFAVAVLPGVIAIAVFTLWFPTAKRDWGSSLVEAVTYSLINLCLWLWWIIPLKNTPFDHDHRWELTFGFVVICIVSPTAIASAWYKLRKGWLHSRLGMDHPMPRGWEYFVTNNREFYILVRLKNGDLIGAYFGETSYAATFPQDPELYVQEMWEVDDDGVFLAPSAGTLGGIIRLSECDLVQFRKVKRQCITQGETNGKEANATTSGLGIGGSPTVGGNGGSGGQGGPTGPSPEPASPTTTASATTCSATA